ncbi:hypothetical protein [Nostoc sp.]|uniref:hypothetical protein n=1 Tax=Nostoc sp. TaxID=1180 RepID=UPI002FF6BC59
MPPIEEVWRLYLRRFTIADWHRFLSFVYIRHLQKLKMRYPEPLHRISTATSKQFFFTRCLLDCAQVQYSQAVERWSDLMPLMTWELWLAQEFNFWVNFCKSIVGLTINHRSFRLINTLNAVE